MKTMAETWFLAKKRFGPAKTIGGNPGVKGAFDASYY
jgi:hypothetical protein